MEKKTILRYAFLSACIIALSILLPYVIKYISSNVTKRILTVNETETEVMTEAEDTGGKVSIGDPDKYVEDQYGQILTGDEAKAYQKYEDMVAGFSDYVKEFTTDITAGDQVNESDINSFLKKNRGQFFEAAASYAYTRWGIDRKIKTIKFDSIVSYTDDNGDDIIQAMVEFLHTSHPDTETGNMVICMYYKAGGYYYFP